MIIGITGGTGCGKTTLLSIIAEHGGVVIDCDKLYHELLRTDTALLSHIAARFPGVIENGILNRKKLGNIVFSDKSALADLNKITHQAVLEAVITQLTPEPPLVAIDAIGLFESGLNKLCKLTVAITAPMEDRVSRLMARDNISREYALARIAAQPSQEEFSSRCDYTLENNQSQEAFQDKCLAFLRDWGIIAI